MSFSESMNQCLRTSLPLLLASLTFLSISLSERSYPDTELAHNWLGVHVANATETVIDYTKNDLLLGFQDTFFWFLVPFFGLICVGVCIAVNFVALGVTHMFALLYRLAHRTMPKSDDGRYVQWLNQAFTSADSNRRASIISVNSPRQRIITTGVLLMLVATVIPYQFAYFVLCIVQIATCTRAWRFAWETVGSARLHMSNNKANRPKAIRL